MATQKENVLIEAGACSVTILPHLGGKIASIRVRGVELLQAPLLPYGPRTRTMGFEQADASGWDECLPSVAACAVEVANGMAEVPDHGDLWRVVWEAMDLEEDSATFRGECFSLPLSLDRTASLARTAKGWRLTLDYRVVNRGAQPTPWSWAAHPLFAVEAGDRIVLPESIHTLRLEGSGGNRLGKGGDSVAWPLAELAGGGSADLSVARDVDSGIGDKLFAGPLSKAENWAALERANLGLRLKVSFDPLNTPYLGLWICNGGWPERPGAKQMCVALEPATAPVDSLAVTGPWSRKLVSGETFSWSMNLDIENL